ncbi:hypothetical protein HYFRA_00002981 [Hymenoscyphus fraxineus]|uniref:Uncharacterized protein n=1 Tax=Hymenoscyphus fraxineus TaxID=746836 RepID=A0A9N9PPL7_9HELO|nr:hypothetical protein HYFRA_00002981 [Hymenoscyphus fraxineus]
MPLASELALTGRRLTASEALSFHLINKISETPESLMDEVLTLAKKVAGQSPDAIIVTRAGLREAWETASVESATKRVGDRYNAGLFEGENFQIGVEAFVKKQKPVWKPNFDGTRVDGTKSGLFQQDFLRRKGISNFHLEEM